MYAPGHKITFISQSLSLVCMKTKMNYTEQSGSRNLFPQWICLKYYESSPHYYDMNVPHSITSGQIPYLPGDEINPVDISTFGMSIMVLEARMRCSWDSLLVHESEWNYHCK